MKLTVRNRCPDFDSYRAARTQSLFNVESAAEFNLDVELPIDGQDWQIGLIVGPSGSGKSSIGRTLWPGTEYRPDWPEDHPIVDAIGAGVPYDSVTAALVAVGLGSVPAWLRPYRVLSTDEQFRANLAHLLCAAPARAIVDEFTSVVDRQVARVGAEAFGKAWRRTAGQIVLLSCHYDIIDWLRPDWIYDTATGNFTRGCLRYRPAQPLKIYETDWRFWPLFQPHHYLTLPHMIAATNYVGFIDNQPVAHVAFTTRPGLIEARAARLVVLPDWQGIGIGGKFLDAVCRAWLQGRNRYKLPLRTLFNTSHPGLAAALRRNPRWTQISARLFGEDKQRSHVSLSRAMSKNAAGYGGHFRAVQGFRYLGDEAG